MSALDSLLPFSEQSQPDNEQQAPQNTASALDSLMPFALELPAAAPSVPPSPVAQPLVGNADGAQQQTITASPVVQ